MNRFYQSKTSSVFQSFEVVNREAITGKHETENYNFGSSKRNKKIYCNKNAVLEKVLMMSSVLIFGHI